MDEEKRCYYRRRATHYNDDDVYAWMDPVGCGVYEYHAVWDSDDTRDCYYTMVCVDAGRRTIMFFKGKGIYHGVVASEDRAYHEPNDGDYDIVKKMLHVHDFAVEFVPHSARSYQLRLLSKAMYVVELGLAHSLPVLVKSRVCSMSVPEWVQMKLPSRKYSFMHFNKMLCDIHDDFRNL